MNCDRDKISFLNCPNDKKAKKKAKGRLFLADVIEQGKEKMQNEHAQNGVTYAIIGSSGCGKSTLIRKIFLDKLYSDDKRFIVNIFTESAKSDAFDELEKTVLIDKKGLDMDAIHFCYHMNSRYDKKYNFVVLLDDVIHIRYNKLIQSMFLTMRNTNITSIVSLQYPKLIPLCVRTSVYFTLLFHFNNTEAVEMVVRGWMAAYLPGKNIHEKMDSYVNWTSGGDGHRLFMVDNLNHTAYRVDENYRCEELQMLSFANPETAPNCSAASEGTDLNSGKSLNVNNLKYEDDDEQQDQQDTRKRKMDPNWFIDQVWNTKKLKQKDYK